MMDWQLMYGIAGSGRLVYNNNNVPYAVVIGGVNIDIGGRSDAPMVQRDSNPGSVTMSLGGVGRNIAHNMCLLGVNVSMLTAFGDDFYAQTIAASCGELGIDITGALKIKGGHTSTYLFLDDCDGDMALAVSDMKIYEHVTPEYIESRLPLINNAKVVVVDTNIPQETLEYLAENCKAPLFIDPVSTIKAVKIRNILGKIHTLKPNKIEAELLSGVHIMDEDSLKKAADTLLSTGMQRVFISLGSGGVYAADHEEQVHIPCFRAVVRNATGAGDAFMGTLGWAFTENKSLKDSAVYASAAAALAVEAEETINSNLSADALENKIQM